MFLKKSCIFRKYLSFFDLLPKSLIIDNNPMLDATDPCSKKLRNRCGKHFMNLRDDYLKVMTW